MFLVYPLPEVIMDKLIIIMLVAIVIFFAPLISIWALNTLFSLGIAYTFKTWLAALVLGSIVSRSVHVKKN
jgi:hypothetical protein